MKSKLIEIQEFDPWAIEDLTQRAKSFFSPYIGNNAKSLGDRTHNGRRVCRCFMCGGWATVTGVLVTNILCDVCGTYAYQLNHGGDVRVYVRDAGRKDIDLVELKINSYDNEYDVTRSINVDFLRKSDRDWLNKLLGE